MLARLIALLAVTLFVPAAAAAKGGKIPWIDKDPEVAMAYAKKTGKGMMLYFTSDG